MSFGRIGSYSKVKALLALILLAVIGTAAFSPEILSLEKVVGFAVSAGDFSGDDNGSSEEGKQPSERDREQLGANDDKFIFGLGNLPLGFPQRRDRIISFSTDGSSQELSAINDFEPAWSPDGRKIAFVSLRDGPITDREIYTMNIDGSDQRRMGGGPFVGGEAQPSFSYHTIPPQQRIVYVADYSGQGRGIYTMNTSGQDHIRLDTDGCFEEEEPEEIRQRSPKISALSPGIYGFDTPNYSPNNNFIIFGYPSQDDVVDIYRINADGTNCIRLYEGEDSTVATTARYSRDGTKIALYHQDLNGLPVHKLRIINSTTGALIQELEPTNFMGSPVWSPNAGENKIAYLAGDQNPDNPISNLEIRTIDLDTEFEEQIISQGVPDGLRGFDWGIPSTVVPQLSMRINAPHPLLGGTSTTGTLYLSSPAPAGGTTITLLAGNPVGQTVISLPSTAILIPEGQTQANFQIDAPNRSDYRGIPIFASRPSPNAASASATVSVWPSMPDLSPISLSGPANIGPGVPFSLNWTIQNIGQAATGSSWTDHVYFSSDDQIDAGDGAPIRTFTNSPSLAAGASRPVTATSITIPASRVPASGQYHLILRVNPNEGLSNGVNEGGRTSNNTVAIPIQIDLPDLVAEDLVVPVVTEPNVQYTLTWTLRNAGSAPSAAFGIRVFFSEDNIAGNADDAQIASFASAAMTPGQSVPQTRDITIPTVPVHPTAPAFFYIQVDYANVVVEAFPGGLGETNNITFQGTQFDYKVSDLQVTSTGTPPEVETETAFPMEWTTTNAGNKATGNFEDRVYFSTDNQVGSDIQIGAFPLAGGLAAGTSVNRIQNVTIPTSAIPVSGNYYVYIRTDAGTNINEGVNEDNNTRFQLVNVRRLLRPDLTITNVTGPPTVFFDQTIQVQWTVTNSGAGPTNSPQWTDRLYIGTSPTSLSGATSLKSTQSVSALNPGESYTASAIVKIPRGINGSYHFLVKTDSSGDLNEENTTNNLSSSPVQVNVPPLPDLIVETVQSPDEVFAGQEISINYTIRNIGDEDAGSRRDRIYFSRDITLNTGQDRLMFTSDIINGLPQGQVTSHISRNRVGTSIPPEYQLARVPSDMEGLWYVFVVADYGDSVYEFNAENNNSNYDGVEPGSPINVLASPPDLVVPNVPTAPATAASGTSFPVDFTVRNQGAFNAAANLYHAVYLSTDQTFDGSDTLIGSFRDTNFFGPGADHPITVPVTLPTCRADGTYYLFAVADYNGRQFEFDPNFDAEANNASPARSIQLSTVPPDLQVTNFQVPQITMPGQSVPLSWTVSNLGGATSRNSIDRVYLRSTTPGIGTQTLGSFEHSGGLLAGGSYTESRSVDLPAFMQDEYFLTITTDVNNNVPECGMAENNNSAQSSNFTVQNNLPDLVIDSVTAPSAAVVGDSFNVQWAGRNANQAMPESAPSWTDSVYLSTDQTFSGGDHKIGSAVNDLILAGGQTYPNQTQVTTGNIPAGTYYVLVYADTGSHIYEGAGNSMPETNNVRASGPITLTTPAIDLQASNVSVLLPHHSGTFRDISWTVTNIGASQTLATQWSDYVILSRDAVIDSADITLGYRVRTAALAGGASYTQSASLFIPSGLTGDYSVFVITDKHNNVVESNNSNNTSPPVTINLTLPPPAELNITNITPPASISLGGNATFSWTVQNTGSNAVNGKWRDTVYLSRDQFWDASDVLAGIRDLDSLTTSVPAGGGTYSPTSSFQVPPVEEGTYYVIVRTDSQNRIRESNEGNNVTTSVGTTTVTITELQLNTPFNTTLGNGAQQFFKYATDPDETLVFSLTTDTPNRSNEAFTNFGSIVSRADYDFQSSRPGEGNQENVIPATQEGDYYSMVRTDLIPESFANNFDRSPAKAGKAKSQFGAAVDPQNITVNARILPFSIRKVSPEEAGNAGYTTMVVDGAKFVEGATLTLVGSGGAEIVPGKFKVLPNQIIALFDLKGKAAGVYDIVVRNPNNATATLEDGFTIINGGGAPEPRITINGPGASRGGRVRYTVSIANDGLNDLLLVPILITMPSQFAYELDGSNHLGDLAEFMQPDAIPSQLPQHYEQDGVRVLGLFTPVLASRRTVNVNIDIVLPFGFPNFKVTAMTLPPMADWQKLSQPEQTNFLNRQISKMGSGTEEECSKKRTKCLLELMRSIIFTVISEALPGGCVGAAWGAALAVSDLVIGMLVKGSDANIYDAIGGISNLIASALGGIAVECLQEAVPWFKLVSIALFSFKGLYDLYDCHRQYNECLPPPPVEKDVSFPFTMDPNEKIGPNGYGAESFVPIRQPLEYRINFENVPEATAPVQIIRVVDTLPPQLDLRTVRLKEIGFKQNRIVIPTNQAFYQNRIQLGADLGDLQADILAGVDLVNNRIFWTIQAIDPQTSDLPTDPFAGLLPPNNANHDGEGYMIFTVEAKPEYPNRTAINNFATIIFDQNEPIITNTTANLLDSVVPTSQIAALAATSATDQFDLSWSGTDDTDGSGFAGHSILYSEDGRGYLPFMNSAAATTTTFTGRWGKSYRFYSIGRDTAGNVEAPPNQPDATITILGGDTEGDVAPRPNGNDGQVSVGDLTQIRRFVAGLDSDYVYNEFQRADTAPLAGNGDGELKTSDIIQARRYAAALDLLQEAAGPNAASVGAIEKASSNPTGALPREIRPVRVSRTGNKLLAAIDLEAQGDEVGVGITLNFSPSVLSNPSNIRLGSGAGAASLTVNDSQANQGRLGIILDKSPTDPIPAGLRQLVLIEFDIAVGAPATTNLSFGNVPVFQEVVNGTAMPVATTFSSAAVSLLSPTAASVTVAGRVSTGSNGISKASVVLTDSQGNARMARTNTFGYFRFQGVVAGQTYIVSVSAKGYRFDPQVILATEDVSGLELICIENN